MVKHGLSNHKIYKLWIELKRRCYNPNAINYKWYGKRGVKICDEWIEDFMSFYNWTLNNGWQEGITIDRIDSNGNYSPENCRFISRSENSKKRCLENRTIRKGSKNPNAILSFSDVHSIRDSDISLKELAIKFNVSYTHILRIKKNERWDFSL